MFDRGDTSVAILKASNIVWGTDAVWGANIVWGTAALKGSLF
jgi:hypothetical protein